MKEFGDQPGAYLLVQLQQHEEQALALLMKKYYQVIYDYAARFTGNSALIKDAIQEVFISLWQRRDTATSIHSIRYYLLGAIKNRVLKALQNEKNNLEHIGNAWNFQFETSFSIEQEIIEKQVHKERVEIVQNILARLSARQREIIYLRFYQQLNQDQIAEMLGISKQSVYNLLYETIQKLKRNREYKVMMKAV